MFASGLLCLDIFMLTTVRCLSDGVNMIIKKRTKNIYILSNRIVITIILNVIMINFITVGKCIINC